MKILVTGGNGQVGWELSQYSSVISLSHAELEITDPKSIHAAIQQIRPDILVNAAAYTAVDKAETESDLAYSINREGPGLLAKACKQNNIPFIHLSTDYLFAGAQSIPYQERDLTAPVNIYGASKLAGEIAVREAWDKHIILRVSGVFSVHGHNFVKTILRLAQEREELRIVADQIICPTPAKNIAETILKICEQLNLEKWGTYHFCSNEPTTWFNFANKIVEIGKQYQALSCQKIIPITTIEYPLPAKRPAYSVLNCAKLQQAFGINLCSWQQELPKIVKQLIFD